MDYFLEPESGQVIARLLQSTRERTRPVSIHFQRPRAFHRAETTLHLTLTADNTFICSHNMADRPSLCICLSYALHGQIAKVKWTVQPSLAARW